MKISRFFIGAILFVFLAIFGFSSSWENPCSSCHESTQSIVDEEKATPSIPSNETYSIVRVIRGKLLQVKSGDIAVIAPVVLGGKTSGFIHPYFLADIPGQPYRYTKADYMAEAGNALTDEESLTAGTFFDSGVTQSFGFAFNKHE